MVNHGADINAKNIHEESSLYAYCESHAIIKTVLEQY